MEVIPDFRSVTLNGFVHHNVAPGPTIYTDGLKSFAGLGTSRIQAYSAHPATAKRPSQWPEIGCGIGEPDHRQSTTMAHRNLSRREPRINCRSILMNVSVRRVPLDVRRVTQQVSAYF
jgi:hypothetical protein